MAEAHVSAPADLSGDLDRIEAAVQAGNTDLKALGFWRLVARVKPDRLLVDRYADQIGRIDAAAFRAFARFRVPVWVGNTILLVGAAVGLGAAIAARLRLVGDARGAPADRRRGHLDRGAALPDALVRGIPGRASASPTTSSAGRRRRVRV